MIEARAKTVEEVRAEFLDCIRQSVRYWAELPGNTDFEKCDGLAFSILCIIDGCRMDLPAMDLVLRPHESDKAFLESEGQDWYEDGMVINDCMLHEAYVSNRG